MSKLGICVIIVTTLAIISGSMAVPPETELPDLAFDPSKYISVIGNNIVWYTSGIMQDLIRNAKHGLKYLHRKLRSLTM